MAARRRLRGQLKQQETKERSAEETLRGVFRPVFPFLITSRVLETLLMDCLPFSPLLTGTIGSIFVNEKS